MGSDLITLVQQGSPLRVLALLWKCSSVDGFLNRNDPILGKNPLHVAAEAGAAVTAAYGCATTINLVLVQVLLFRLMRADSTYTCAFVADGAVTQCCCAPFPRC